MDVRSKLGYKETAASSWHGAPLFFPGAPWGTQVAIL